MASGGNIWEEEIDEFDRNSYRAMSHPRAQRKEHRTGMAAQGDIKLIGLFARLPAYPAAGHHTPDLALATAEVVQFETLHLDLFALTTLLPGPDLLLGAIPVNDNADVVGFTHFSTVLLVHCATVTLEPSVPEADNVTSADLIVLRNGCIG